MADPLLLARNLRIRRTSRAGSFELEVASFEVRGGEVLAVLGPNGAGKSTLLRALAGLLPVDSGSVELARDAVVTMVFQSPIPFAGSVAHNLRSALRGQRLSSDRMRSRIDEGLEYFGISHLANHRAHTLSGGELRRLALARAFALKPDVLLLDEPFDDLDNATEESLSVDLRRVLAETGVAVVVVTHDLRRALLLADRIAVLMRGRLVQEGTRDEVLAHPADVDVARQVGMLNLLPARVRGGDSPAPNPGSGVAELENGLRLPIPGGGSEGASVWLGIRPEEIEVGKGAEGTALGKAVVRGNLSDGIAQFVTLEWHGVMLRMHRLAGRRQQQDLQVGDSVDLGVHPTAIHVMPRADSTSAGPAEPPVRKDP